MLARFRSIFREYIGIPSRQFLLEWKFRLRSSQGGKGFGNNRFPRVMVFTQVRDEADIIRDWIAYHLDLFGRGNVVVMDDYSRDGTADILKEFGEDIIVESLLPEDQETFNRKHNLTRKMAEFKGEADLLLPLDADEFVALDGDVDKEKIISYIRSLDLVGWGVFKFRNELESVTYAEFHKRPVLEIQRFHKTKPGYDSRKVFFSASQFESVGMGQHTGYTYNDNKLAYTTRLNLYHFKWRGKKQMLEKCKKGADSYNKWWRKGVGGGHYHRGKAAYEDGEFDAFVRVEVGQKSWHESAELARRIIGLTDCD